MACQWQQQLCDEAPSGADILSQQQRQVSTCLWSLLWWQRLLCSALKRTICPELVERVGRHDRRLPTGEEPWSSGQLYLWTIVWCVAVCVSLCPRITMAVRRASRVGTDELTCELQAAAGCSEHLCGLRWMPAQQSSSANHTPSQSVLALRHAWLPANLEALSPEQHRPGCVPTSSSTMFACGMPPRVTASA